MNTTNNENYKFIMPKRSSCFSKPAMEIEVKRKVNGGKNVKRKVEWLGTSHSLPLAKNIKIDLNGLVN